MELLQLQYFIEVVQQQSVTKAAEKLHISQPSLSQSLHRLQQEVGISIFQKDGRKLRLTESGRTFYLRIANALQAITNACEEANGTILQGNILIGTYMPIRPLIPCLEAFTSQNPDITFSIFDIVNVYVL